MGRNMLIAISLVFLASPTKAFQLTDVIITDWIRGEVILTCNSVVRLMDESWDATYNFNNSGDTVKPYLKCLAENQLKACPPTGSLPRNEDVNYLGPFRVLPTEVKYQFFIPEYPTEESSKELMTLQALKMGGELVSLTSDDKNLSLVLQAQVLKNESVRSDVWVLQKTASKIEMIAFYDNDSYTGTKTFMVRDGVLSIFDTTTPWPGVEYGYCNWKKGEGDVPFGLDAQQIEEIKKLLDSN